MFAFRRLELQLRLLSSRQLAIMVRKYCSHIDLAIVFFRTRSVRGAGYQQTTVIHDSNKCYPSEATAAAMVGSALEKIMYKKII